MPVTTLKKLVDRKSWAGCAPPPAAVTQTSYINVSESFLPDNHVLIPTAVGAAWIYEPFEDGWISLPTPNLTALGLGTCCAFHPMGPTGTASAGSASGITTTLTLLANLRPGPDGRAYRLRLTGGAGAGQELPIASNTVGANASVTVSGTFSPAPDNTTTYVLITGRHFVYGGGSASNSWRYWDHATQAWSSGLSLTSGPNFSAGEGMMVTTPSLLGPAGWQVDPTAKTSLGFATGTATAGAASTLTNSGKSWTTNQWANFQCRIRSGTGAGQVRTIASNTGTVLTMSAAWTTNPDNTSVYVIEGNDDFIYVLGNNAVTLFRYSISGNSWSTLSPGAARSGAPSASGVWAKWASGSDGTDWTSESVHRNGQRIYSGRGGSFTTIDYYDIAANAWVSSLSYGRQSTGFSQGISCTYDLGNYIYLAQPFVNNVTSVVRFNIRDQVLEAVSTLVIPGGALVNGSRAFMAQYDDRATVPSATALKWLYVPLMTTAAMYRCLII